ncbi:sulfite exporter TauE/SafE family protein [Coprobacter tertius]|uniref:Probable membrane transporter protein n=1 Tax=Coprobacter tertius TaxID=2944915 RepID=A0ABT1MH12_9BACT|nr:sulfite exporter TauE/SafE family protein [Coprobacter tertius]MCP9611923.1 sulfite exporter TauE/SafE family protein [Coprobacter tertius]
MTFISILLLLGSGILCGIVNVIGGGGSLLALPVLLSLGLPAGVANGTNRIAIIFQDVSSLLMFRKKRQLDLKEGLRLTLPVLFGAIAGAWLAAFYLTENLMNIVILVLSLLMIAALFFQPDKWTRAISGNEKHKLTLTNVLLFFIIGLYGGFIQAGFTYLILAVLVLKCGYTMVKGDALKLFLNLMILPVALVIFIWQGQVQWLYGIVMGIGSALGGYLGVRFVNAWSPKLIRSIMLILLVMAVLYIIFVRM